ncbi:MAG: nicotinate (nicotinamide) nucleotide adenylyltransferase [Hominenteromicrobium sp.]
MRTGIYGGTFNPIHLAHVRLLREFARRLSLDRLILIPTGTPPHKAAHQLASGADRLEMCRLASADIAECPVEVSELEVRREGRSYTADTLETLRAQYPGDELFLLMGEDMFMTVERWYHPERIFRAAVICAAPRDYGSFRSLVRHGEAVRQAYPSFSFIIQNIPYLPVSSTEVRARLESGGELSDLVPACVEQYIRERGLYQP